MAVRCLLCVGFTSFRKTILGQSWKDATNFGFRRKTGDQGSDGEQGNILLWLIFLDFTVIFAYNSFTTTAQIQLSLASDKREWGSLTTSISGQHCSEPLKSTPNWVGWRQTRANLG